MKKISPSILPHFHGLTLEEPDTFLFECTFMFRTYDYTSDDHKLKLFSSTLKDVALSWFMSLSGDNITTWAQMKQAFDHKCIIIVGPNTLKRKYLEWPWDMMSLLKIIRKGSNSTTDRSYAPSILNHSS